MSASELPLRQLEQLRARGRVSTYSKAGGGGKTTAAANLAVAHARAGLNPLIVPLDLQDGGLSRLFGVDTNRTESADNVVRHIIRRPKGDFEDLTRAAERVDMIPEYNMLSDLGEYLQREKQQAKAMCEAFGMHSPLLRVPNKAGVLEQCDILICDPLATEGSYLYNIINATRSLVIPVEPGAEARAVIK